MTHAIADAEAAIARHPDSLEALSMAADLLQELGDPRGADFAVCMAGDLSAEDLMRRHPADVSAMFVAAWRMAADHEECPKCAEYNGVGRVPVDANGYRGGMITCPRCLGSGSNGAADRAEGLRLLAACGKVGEEREPRSERGGWYFSSPDIEQEGDPPVPPEAMIPFPWLDEMAQLVRETGDRVSERLALIDAYARATPDTRRRWAEQTRALTAGTPEAAT